MCGMKYAIKCRLFTRNYHAIGLIPRLVKANFMRRKSKNAGECMENSLSVA